MKTLEHSDELYRAIVETAGEGIWVVDANDRTTFVNPQLAELLGYEPHELLGKAPESFIEDSWVERAGTELERLRQGIPVRAELPFRRKDGTLIETLLSCRPVHDVDGRYVGAVALVTDVTEQRRAQRELEASELRFRTLVERLPGATYIKDVDRNFTYVSPQASELFGIPHDEWDGRGSDLWRELVHPDDRDAVLEGVERSQADGTPFAETFRLVTPARGTVWVQDETYPITDGSGNFLYWQGLILDVTARMEAEEGLRRSERMFRTMFDNEPECVKLVARDGSLLEMNGAGLEIVEAESFDGLRGRQITEIVAPEHREAFRELHRGVLRGERRNLEFDIIGLRGTRRSLETTAAPLRDDTGAIIGHLGVTRDVTSRRKLESDLRRAQRMEGLGRIAGGVAHDFNNILTAIIGYGESITRRGREEAEDAREILRAADRAAELVQQLLVFSSRQLLERKVLDLNEVVRETERMLSRALGEHIDVICALSDDVRPVEADAGQLQQVILNLALNARDAMPSGGVLTLETRNVAVDDDGALPTGEYVQLTVTDTGSGMAEDVREHVFDPFFTTKAAGEGTGLGLATVYGIVNQSGGHIVVYSEPELGTSFKVYLPASSQAAPEAASDDQELPSAPATATVLLVEDEIVVRHLVREILEREGYTVLEAETPEQAIATSDDPGEIDLLLTDVVMPRMSGPEIARALGTARGDLKVLYMSGYSDAAVVQRGLLEPGTAFIQKPFRARELTAKVRSLLERG